MTTYLDTSVVLRWVLGAPDALPRPDDDAPRVTTRLTLAEALRTLDRLHRRGQLSEGGYAERHGIAIRLLDRVDRIHLYVAVLRRAAEPFPTPVGTLDAIHLSTALQVRDTHGVEVVLATHDLELARAARAVGLDVVGA